MEFKNYQLIDRTINIVEAMLKSDNNGTTDLRAHQIAEALEIIYNKLSELDGRPPKVGKVAEKMVHELEAPKPNVESDETKINPPIPPTKI